MLLTKFSKCSYEVKCQLYRTYCSNLYCSQFWVQVTKKNMQKMIVSYNNGLRRLLSLPSRNSASEMFVSLGIPSFSEMHRNYIKSIMTHIECSENMLVYYCFSNLTVIKKFWYENSLSNHNNL